MKSAGIQEDCLIPGQDDSTASLLSDKGDNGWHYERQFGPAKDECGWNEILSISVSNKDSAITSQHVDKELAHPLTHYVFWKEERNGTKWFKFYGMFKLDADATLLAKTTGRPQAVYACIGKSAPCIKVEEKKQTFTDDEFQALKGRSVSINFLDEIGVLSDSGDAIEGMFKAWPGMRLVVTGATNDCVHATCNGKRFSIPRQDFALGYVEILPDERQV